VRQVRVAIAVLLLLTASPAAADPSKSFVDARTVFRSGQYKEAAILFSGLLYPTTQLSDLKEVIDAHVHLAVASFEIGQLENAKREFDAAISLDSTLDISGYGFSKEATDFFKKRKTELDDRARKIEERTRRARERQKFLKSVDLIRVKERKNYLRNLIPFGVGQFQNNQTRKGVFFAATEIGLGATSFVIWTYLRGRYPDGRVPLTEVDAARRLQIFEITSATLCIGAMAWGVVDGFVNYSEEARPLTEEEKKETIEQLMQEEREDKESALRITPMITPDGAGAALSWEF
jgi:tetratricopeptide (TPR) repeat protein